MRKLIADNTQPAVTGTGDGRAITGTDIEVESSLKRGLDFNQLNKYHRSGYQIIQLAIEDLLNGSSYDAVTVEYADDVETIKFNLDGVTQKEFQITYTADSISLVEIPGRLLLESGLGDLLTEDGDTLVQET